MDYYLMLSNMDFLSAFSGLTGAVFLYFFGLPPKIDPEGHIHIIAEQKDEEEKKRGKKYKIMSKLGIGLVALSFLLQIIEIINIK